MNLTKPSKVPRNLLLLGCLMVPATAFSETETEKNPCRELLAKQVDGEIQRQRQIKIQRKRAEEESSWFDVFKGESREAPSAQTTEAKAPSMAKDARKPAPKRSMRAKSERSTGRSVGKKSGPSSYSRTNTQEQAVDEGDIIKTNGRYVYHVSCNRSGGSAGCRNEIRIYASWPVRKSKLIARYTIPQTPKTRAMPQVKQIYLYGDQVAVLLATQNPHGARSPAEMSELPKTEIVNSNHQVARVLLLDVKEPSQPRMVRELFVDGVFVESRMIGSRLYLATKTPGLRVPHLMRAEIRKMLNSMSQEEINQITAGAVIDKLDRKWRRFILKDPGLARARELVGHHDSRPVYSCSDLHVDQTTQGQQILNLLHLDLDKETKVIGAGVAGYAHGSKVYASEGAFYVADLVRHQIRQRGWQTASLLRKFDLSRGGKPRFVARGLVRGHLLNQFSMSEYAGYLRVATSDNWQSNNLYVLQTVNDQLRTIGVLENMGRNERIYAVRMMGSRGYIVTFRRTDPLYTLDLSDPTRPQLVGELHVNGFSNYLHPLDDTHLLAVGQDATSRGRQLGFHLQIFDVSDPSKPTRKFHEKLEAGSQSATQQDHHAFMFEPQTKTLAMPWKGKNYWGLIAYKVDAKRGFRKLGRVNHALLYKRFFKQQCARSDSAECGNKNYWWQFFTRPDLTVDRVIAIENNLFSFSPSGAMVHRVGKRLRQRATVLVNKPSWRAPNQSAVARR